MKSFVVTGLPARGRHCGSSKRITRVIIMIYTCASLAIACASASGKTVSKKNHEDGDGEPSFSRGLHEYRRVGTDLVGLWREYIAMSDSLSHALRDYNVSIRQEQRAELARALANKHQKAEALTAQNAKQGSVSSTVLYGELAGLKELKRQMKDLDRRVGEIPDYRFPEQNLLLLQGATAPVNVSKALSHSSATLFHKALASYYTHVEEFNKRFQTLRSFLKDVKMSPDGSDRLVKQKAELGDIFDTDAPIAIHSPTK